jgi:hypothetical protein
MRDDQPERGPREILGVPAGASQAEIAAAYHRAVRACHPDANPGEDPVRLAAVIAAYHALRQTAESPAKQETRTGGTPVPVRVHRTPPGRDPDLRAGPVRRH